jgi:hypothetical protein
LLLDKFALKNDIVTRDADLYSAATLLVAAKMREVDTKTPFVSEVKRFDSKIFFFNDKSYDLVFQRSERERDRDF